MQFLMSIKTEDLDEIKDAQTFADKYVTYVEVDINNKYDDIITGILSGTIALMIEGFDQIIMIDARTYPARGIEEPNDDRFLRGSRDGFVAVSYTHLAFFPNKKQICRIIKTA